MYYLGSEKEGNSLKAKAVGKMNGADAIFITNLNSCKFCIYFSEFMKKDDSDHYWRMTKYELFLFFHSNLVSNALIYIHLIFRGRK